MLNISHNIISNLSGLQHCTSLSTLICSQNSLSGFDSINALSHCKELSTADLQDNDLDSDAVSPTALFFSLYDLLAPVTHVQRALCPKPCHSADAHAAAASQQTNSVPQLATGVHPEILAAVYS